MVSIGNLTSRQVAVSGGHGISRMVKTIGSIVAKVYNGLRTWGSATTSRSQLNKLSRPAPVLKKLSVSGARKSHVAPRLEITKTGVAGEAFSETNRNGKKSKIIVSAKPTAIELAKTNNIISQVRKSNPARHIKNY